jgi:hypothetical protein
MSKKIFRADVRILYPCKRCILLMENYLLLERRTKIINALKEYWPLYNVMQSSHPR